VQAVYLIFVALLLINCAFVEFQTFCVTRLLPFRHLAFRFPQLSIGYGFQSLFRFSGRFGPLRMLTVVCLTQQFFALFFVFAALLNTFSFGYLIAFVYHFPTHFRTGRKGRIIALNRRVGQHKFGLFDNLFAVKMHAVSKNLLKTRFADTPAEMNKVTRITGKFMLEKHPAAKVLKVNIPNPDSGIHSSPGLYKRLSIKMPTINRIGMEGRSDFPEYKLLNASSKYFQSVLFAKRAGSCSGLIKSARRVRNNSR
jgi:hypothetical protein